LVNSPKWRSIDASNICKTAEKKFRMMDVVVEEVREENLIQIVVDNATNYKAGIVNAKETS